MIWLALLILDVSLWSSPTLYCCLRASATAMIHHPCPTAHALTHALTHAVRRVLSIHINALEERFKEIVMVNPSPLVPHLFFPDRWIIVYYWSPVKFSRVPIHLLKGTKQTPLSHFSSFSALTAELFNSAAHTRETYLSLIRLLVFEALLITKLAQNAVWL